MRAEEDRVDAPALLGQQLVQLGMHRIERPHVEQAAAEPRLIARHHHVIAGMVQPRDRLQRAGQRHPFVGRLDVVVAIEDDEFHAASFDRSATRFIAACNAPSSARRLARSFGSSALTITSSKKASTGVRSAASSRSDAAYSPLSNSETA